MLKKSAVENSCCCKYVLATGEGRSIKEEAIENKIFVCNIAPDVKIILFDSYVSVKTYFEASEVQKQVIMSIISFLLVAWWGGGGGRRHSSIWSSATHS